MTTLSLVKATKAELEEVYEIYYRTLCKLFSEGRGNEFGGMDKESVERCFNNGNANYLLYRENDKLPVGAVSIVKKENYKELQDVSNDNIAVLYAIAVRPELWGQGYARHMMSLLKDELKKQGIDILTGTFYPGNLAKMKLYTGASKDGEVYTGKTYTWTTPKGRVLERQRFIFRI